MLKPHCWGIKHEQVFFFSTLQKENSRQLGQHGFFLDTCTCQLSICMFVHFHYLSFWVLSSQIIVEKASEAEMKSFKNQCSIDIDWVSMEDLLHPTNYVEHWKLILQNKVCYLHFDEKGIWRALKDSISWNLRKTQSYQARRLLVISFSCLLVYIVDLHCKLGRWQL